MFLVEQVTSQDFLFYWHHIGWGSMASHSSQHDLRHSSLVSHHKGFHLRYFGRPGAQGSAISAFHPLAPLRHVA